MDEVPWIQLTSKQSRNQVWVRADAIVLTVDSELGHQHGAVIELSGGQTYRVEETSDEVLVAIDRLVDEGKP
jgi:hypothetical protein